MKRLLVPVLALLLTFMLHGAALADQASKQTALDTAKAWLGMVDAGEYQQSYDAAAKIFKTAVTADKFKQQIAAARGTMGALSSREVTSAKYHTSLSGAPDGKYWIIQFKTSFANKKQAVETVTVMMDPDGAWRAAGYYIK